MKVTEQECNFDSFSFNVKSYIPLQKKMEIVQNIVQAAFNNNANYANPGLVDVYFWIEIVKNYTDIEIPNNMDYSDIYDILESNQLIGQISHAISSTEISDIRNYLHETIKGIYKYNNSAAGIIANMSADYDQLSLDADQIRQKIGDKEGLEFLQEVLSKLG